jgi:hypothetical protein
VCPPSSSCTRAGCHTCVQGEIERCSEQASGIQTETFQTLSVGKRDSSGGVQTTGNQVASPVAYDFEACAFTAHSNTLRDLWAWMMRASEDELHPSTKTAMWALPWERNKRLATAMDMFMRVFHSWLHQRDHDDPDSTDEADDNSDKADNADKAEQRVHEARLVGAACLVLADAVCMVGNGLYFSIETPKLAAYARVKPYVLHVAAHRVMILLRGKLMASGLTLPDMFTGWERTHPVVASSCTAALLGMCAGQADVVQLAVGIRAQLWSAEAAGVAACSSPEEEASDSSSVKEPRCQKRRYSSRDKDGVKRTIEYAKIKLRRVKG